MKVKDFKAMIAGISEEDDELEIYAAPLMEIDVLNDPDSIKKIIPSILQVYPIDKFVKTGSPGEFGLENAAMVLGFDSKTNIAAESESLDDDLNENPELIS